MYLENRIDNGRKEAILAYKRSNIQVFASERREMKLTKSQERLLWAFGIGFALLLDILAVIV